jgi:alkanesulfonate monooxygenase SsuD/methylene tetrahydromethanopterin reductase-like flavin-dependent oxidoreductase (luciferase family)
LRLSGYLILDKSAIRHSRKAVKVWMMVKFGLVIWKTLDLRHYSYEVIRELAIEGERLGFESFWLADHFRAVTPRDPYYECYTTLAALAAETRRIRLGPLVSCVSYRSPSLLAKVASTLDVVTGGRSEFTLGAGWDVDEYNSYGIPFPRASVRVKQVEEALHIVEKMWTEDEATFQGEFFRVENAICKPSPLQKPHPPIWLGCKQRKMLGLVARYADGWSTESAFTPQIYAQRLRLLEAACDAAGRKLTSIRKSVATDVIIEPTMGRVQETVRDYCSRFDLTPESCFEQKIVGTPAEVTERLREFVDLGADLVICHFVNGHTLGPLRLFSEEVVSKFR